VITETLFLTPIINLNLSPITFTLTKNCRMVGLTNP